MISMFVLAAALTLPNPTFTPGVTANVPNVCAVKWGKDERHITEAMKKHVADLYHVPPESITRDKKHHIHYHWPSYEFDHLISRELGGADDESNLWPQPRFGVWNAHRKDVLENKLHALVCRGELTLEEAQTAIRTNWIDAYRRFVENID